MLAGAPVPRLMLHAAALEFPHPHGGFRRIAAPPPEDFQVLAARLGLPLERSGNLGHSEAGDASTSSR
jgi:tRNA pseudouridine32 synthase/23S rRNA pseudouridine746 synthase